jgi:hypothetical protein
MPRDSGRGHSGLRGLIRLTSVAAIGLMALAALSLPARAQDYPSIVPMRDAKVVYSVNSTSTGPMRIEVFAQPATQTLRVQLDGQQDYLLVDRGQEQAMLVAPDKGMVFVVPTNGMLHRQLDRSSGLRFQRAGSRMIAGSECTVWRLEGPSGRGDACVTQDGIVLAGEGHGDRANDQGQVPAGKLIAVSVDYDPQPPEFFEAPDGLPQVNLPPAMLAAMVPGLAGLLPPQ